MNTFKNHKFEGLDDFDTGSIFSDMVFENCSFTGCVFSTTMDINKRSIARNLQFIKCSVRGTSIGPGIVEDLVIDKLSVHGHLQSCGAVFKHVTIRGTVNKLMITPFYDLYGRFPETKISFDNANADYYSKIDWALDISEGIFTDCDIRGIPANLIKRDAETQIVIKREKALSGNWKKFNFKDNFVTVSLERFLNDEFDDCVLIAPKKSKHFEYILHDLNLLKEHGITELD
jgi:hypothetical protein